MFVNPFDKAARYAAKQLNAEGFLRGCWVMLLTHWRWMGVDAQTLPFPGEPDRRSDTIAAFDARPATDRRRRRLWNFNRGCKAICSNVWRSMSYGFAVNVREIQAACRLRGHWRSPQPDGQAASGNMDDGAAGLRRGRLAIPARVRTLREETHRRRWRTLSKDEPRGVFCRGFP